MMMGVKRKTGRFFDPHNGKTMILPMDHGVSQGLIPGLGNLGKLIEDISKTRVRGVVLHKGMAQEYADKLSFNQNLIIHMSAGTKHGLPPYGKTLVCSIQEALRLGADAVSVHINIGNDLEDRMLSDLGMVVDEAHQLGLPVMAMIYARGGQIINELDPHLVAHCIRLGAELGADLVKTPFSNEQKIFSMAVASCPVPVVIAGGSKQADFKRLIQMVKKAMDCGARGVSIGRNIFQHPKPLEALEQLWEAVSA
jgi:fructose-bisphosphate aldolase, class I